MDFVEWLEQQMTQRHWQNSDLARAAGINPSTLARILSRQRNAGPDTCRALARALNMTQEGIFRRAGLLDPLPPPIVDENEIKNTIIVWIALCSDFLAWFNPYYFISLNK